MSYRQTAILNEAPKTHQKAAKTVRNFLILSTKYCPQVAHLKYFSRNAFRMNILQGVPPCKILKISILRAKYPKGGGGYHRPDRGQTHAIHQRQTAFYWFT